MVMLRPILIALAVAALVGGIAWQNALNAARGELDQSLVLTARAVETEVERLRALPAVAAEDARIQGVLAGTGSVRDANIYLEAVAVHAQADELFLIDATGQTIAASNWNRPGSFVGHNYAFRPYFTEALSQGEGHFYAIGVTTGVPGYFLSTRIDLGDTQGVMVVKLDLRPLQDTWRMAGADVALADEHGVVFLSAREDWQYRALAPLSKAQLDRIASTRAYEGVDLAQGSPLLRVPPADTNLSGRGWIARMAPMQATGWQMIAVAPVAGIHWLAMGWAGLAALASLAVTAAIKTREQRQQIIALRLSQSEKLESMVEARTADLAREVQARTQAELDLRTAQEALVHTEKMAALGRMSTAIVHEMSQPLAAMEATLSAAEMGLQTRDTATVSRLNKAREMIRRMQRTTKHLKSFARREASELTLVDMRLPVASALDLVEPRVRASGVVPELHTPDEPVWVMGGTVRIEQVVVNLLLNALDAVAGRPEATIRVKLYRETGQALLEVTDTGCGIAQENLSQVTEPFISSKISGEGLGLGLAISKAILANFKGTLDIQSELDRGTRVTVSLPLVKENECVAA
jgi:two-component system C4-dicarboxylate transport sensor histidine kinase DctB